MRRNLLLIGLFALGALVPCQADICASSGTKTTLAINSQDVDIDKATLLETSATSKVYSPEGFPDVNITLGNDNSVGYKSAGDEQIELSSKLQLDGLSKIMSDINIALTNRLQSVVGLPVQGVDLLMDLEAVKLQIISDLIKTMTLTQTVYLDGTPVDLKTAELLESTPEYKIYLPEGYPNIQLKMFNDGSLEINTLAGHLPEIEIKTDYMKQISDLVQTLVDTHMNMLTNVLSGELGLLGNLNGNITAVAQDLVYNKIAQLKSTMASVQDMINKQLGFASDFKNSAAEALSSMIDAKINSMNSTLRGLTQILDNKMDYVNSWAFNVTSQMKLFLDNELGQLRGLVRDRMTMIQALAQDKGEMLKRLSGNVGALLNSMISNRLNTIQNLMNRGLNVNNALPQMVNNQIQLLKSLSRNMTSIVQNVFTANRRNILDLMAGKSQLLQMIPRMVGDKLDLLKRMSTEAASILEAAVNFRLNFIPDAPELLQPKINAALGMMNDFILEKQTEINKILNGFEFDQLFSAGGRMLDLMTTEPTEVTADAKIYEMEGMKIRVWNNGTMSVNFNGVPSAMVDYEAPMPDMSMPEIMKRMQSMLDTQLSNLGKLPDMGTEVMKDFFDNFNKDDLRDFLYSVTQYQNVTINGVEYDLQKATTVSENCSVAILSLPEFPDLRILQFVNGSLAFEGAAGLDIGVVMTPGLSNVVTDTLFRLIDEIALLKTSAVSNQMDMFSNSLSGNLGSLGSLINSKMSDLSNYLMSRVQMLPPLNKILEGIRQRMTPVFQMFVDARLNLANAMMSAAGNQIDELAQIPGIGETAAAQLAGLRENLYNALMQTAVMSHEGVSLNGAQIDLGSSPMIDISGSSTTYEVSPGVTVTRNRDGSLALNGDFTGKFNVKVSSAMSTSLMPRIMASVRDFINSKINTVSQMSVLNANSLKDLGSMNGFTLPSILQTITRTAVALNGTRVDFSQAALVDRAADYMTYIPFNYPQLRITLWNDGGVSVDGEGDVKLSMVSGMPVGLSNSLLDAVNKLVSWQMNFASNLSNGMLGALSDAVRSGTPVTQNLGSTLSNSISNLLGGGGGVSGSASVNVGGSASAGGSTTGSTGTPTGLSGLISAFNPLNLFKRNNV